MPARAVQTCQERAWAARPLSGDFDGRAGFTSVTAGRSRVSPA